ncbi:hypothetical protein MLD63_08475 [Paracoccus sp. TK19116]|uniref:Uncharacterized protein n=1 Tax=Paracoccus albicereus TaxID=2922394 RepID=A0ABT1MUC2_9RHOB|nr:hypothetical protein [Paracoccus albicereus]MCQ0970456.1 hypothetical protein [Paracoccus albicereus]
MAEPTKPNTGALREAIDSGRTADKVDHRDPASAPLGTDDEASGHPNSPEQVERAMEQEVVSETSDEPKEDLDDQVRDDPRKFFVFIGLVAIAAIGVVLVAIL